MLRSIGTTIIGTCALFATTSTATAAFALPDDPINAPDSWTRGTANSTFAEWQSFSSSYLGTNAPQTYFNASAPNLQQLNQPEPAGPPFGASVIIASSGNIYGPGDILNIGINVPNPNLGPSATTDVILQVIATSPGISDASVKLDGVSPDLADAVVVGTIDTPGGPADVLAKWFKWDNLSGNLDEYLITFDAAGFHVSLDAVAVDTYATVPEPAFAGLASIVGIAFLRRRR